MQYGVDIFPYKRIFKNKNNNKQENRYINISKTKKLFLYIIMGFLISRVTLVNEMAPFGVAFMLAVCLNKDEQLQFSAGVGALLGYLTLINKIQSVGEYILILGSILLTGYIFKKRNKSISLARKIVVYLTPMYIIFFIFNIFILNYTLGISFFSSILKGSCILPIYYIMEYSILCFDKLKTKHLFTNEELISMAITISLIIAGTWGVSIYNISLTNILALLSILIIGYINGGLIGAAAGVAIGTIVGMTTNDMMVYISLYGLCGLLAGVFKNSGKWLSASSFLIGYFILSMYSEPLEAFKGLEGLISFIIFLVIPNKIYSILLLELNTDVKRENIKKDYMEKIKSIYIERLNSFSDVLGNISSILTGLADNDKLAMKNKSSALIEKLADRVCGNCTMKSMCWKREIYYTYTAFGDLIQNYQEKRNNIPYELDRKCIKRKELLNNTEDIVNEFIMNEMWRSRLSEGRELLASQINNMAISVQEITEEFNSQIQVKSNLEVKLTNLFRKVKVKVHDVLCFEDRNGRLNIRITLKACGGKQLCVKTILPIINEATSKCMCVINEGCSINEVTGMCSVSFEETPLYHISSYIAYNTKEGESISGDSYDFGDIKDGNYLSVLSDGMGSGPKANQESSAIVELVDKFARAGFSEEIAINTVNSLMSIKLSDEEKYSTVDLCSVDLYSGNAKFMKVGAVQSIVKRGNEVNIIDCKSLPIGVLDKVDIDETEFKLNEGDMIIMFTDGILDYDSNNAANIEWLIEYIKECDIDTPKELANGIMNTCVKLSKGKLKDDMTLIVSKIYNLY